MIIDFHTHIFPDALAPRALESLASKVRGVYSPSTDMTCAGLVREMDRCGVDISVVQPVITKPSQLKTTNEWAKSICSDRIISFGGIFPGENYRDDIDFVRSLGLRGIKLHPEYQNFQVDDPLMLKIYDYAFSRGLAVLIHAGTDPGLPPPYKSSPRAFRRVADEMRGGVLVAAHLGGHLQWDDVEKYLAGTSVYLDTSMGQSEYPREQFLRIVENHGADRILFATDSPWSNAEAEIASIRSLPLTDDEKEKIFHINAEKILGIK